QLWEPLRIDIDVACGAGAGAAAIGIDAGNAVLDGAFHHGPADGNVGGVLLAVVFDVFDLRHTNGFRVQAKDLAGIEISARRSGVTAARAAISLRPTMYSGAALTASTAATMPSRRWKTANFRAAGLPRSTVTSPGWARPAICILRSYWSDQNHGTSRYGAGRPSM